MANKNDTERQTKMIQSGKQKRNRTANENDTKWQNKSDTEWQYKSDTLDHFLYKKKKKMPF